MVMLSGIRLPIAFKLIFVTISLLLGVSAWISFECVKRFEQVFTERAEEASRHQSRSRATEVEGLLLSYIDKVKIIGALLLKEQGNERERSLDLTFSRDRDFVSVEILSRPAASSPLRAVNEEYLRQYGLDKTFIDTLRAVQKTRGLIRLDTLFGGQDGHVEVRNSTILGGAPLLTIGFPLVKDEDGIVTHIVLAEVRLDRLQKTFALTSENSIYLVDRDGNLLAHPEEKRVLKSESMRSVPIVQAALTSTVKQGQKHFKESGKSFTGAYTKTAIGVTTVAVASDEILLEAARSIRRDSLHIAGQLISVAFFIMFLVSITLTNPIEKLAELTNEVAKGNFKVRADVKSRDEVGQLGRAFNHMIQGLLERDKVKMMFSKFHGSSVTEDLMKGDLHLGGSKKTITVFFSDIRDFTKFSEGHTPEQVVEMLNEYFEVMVRIINQNGGVVDKFIGDAIMAVWGAPKASERDSHNAVKSALAMRVALAELNVGRAERGKVPIRIGMGLHRGEAISGTIGSQERMEYTVIGDTVNQASRVEASTKSFGADLLLTQEMADLVQGEFIVELAGHVEVKGKTEPLSLYKVRGYIDPQGQKVEVVTPFSDYEAGHDAKVKKTG